MSDRTDLKQIIAPFFEDADYEGQALNTADDLLAALAAEGWSLHRLDDYPLVHRVEIPGVEASRTYYRMVPVESGETEE